MIDNQTNKAVTKAGDLAQLVSPTNKLYFIQLTTGNQLHTHRGIIKIDNLIGIPWGSTIESHLGSKFYLLQPTIATIVQTTRRNTQIMYPKDIGFTLMTMNIGPGSVVIEAGTGSGALTTAFAWAVGSDGRVLSYESRPEMQNLARKNLERVNMSSRVVLILRDIKEGFSEQGVDAIFLDLPNPYDYLAQVKNSLKLGGYFGSILPTVNQVERLLIALHENYFAFVDVCEIILRYYKPNPVRLRPTDRMVAHTGYLVFARSIITTSPQ